MDIHKDLNAESRLSYYASVMTYLEEETRYYRSKRKRRRLATNALRTGAIVSVGAGILLPLLGDFPAWLLQQPNVSPREGMAWAYVAVATGALLLLVDQVFTVSSSWARFMVTELQLNAVKYELQFAWAKHYPTTVSLPPGSRHARAMLDTLQKAKLRAHGIIEAETSTWVSQLDKARAALDEKIGAYGAPPRVR